MKDAEAAGTTCPYCARQNVASNISCAVGSDIYDCDGSCPYCGTTWSFRRVGSFIPMVHAEKAAHKMPNRNLEYERKVDAAEDMIRGMLRRLDDLQSRSQDALYRSRNFEGRICALEMENKKGKSRSDAIISRLKDARLSVIAEQLKNYREEFLEEEGSSDDAE